MSYPYYEKFYDVEELKDYELFIGPNGEYYKVKTTYESDEDCTHYEWATGYLERNNLSYLLETEEMKNMGFTPLKILIHYLGFVRYTHTNLSKKPLFNIPKPEYFGNRLKEVQKQAIYKIMKYNNETLTDEIIKQLEYDEINYDNKRDQVFERIVRRSR